MIPRWVEAYTGLRYALNGRARDGIDCWGLARLVFAERCGIDLPAYGPYDAGETIAIARLMRAQAGSQVWRQVEQPACYDVALLRGGHVGLMISPVHMLHIQEVTASLVASVGDVRVRSRILGFFRHEQLTA